MFVEFDVSFANGVVKSTMTSSTPHISNRRIDGDGRVMMLVMSAMIRVMVAVMTAIALIMLERATMIIDGVLFSLFPRQEMTSCASRATAATESMTTKSLIICSTTPASAHS